MSQKQNQSLDDNLIKPYEDALPKIVFKAMLYNDWTNVPDEMRCRAIAAMCKKNEIAIIQNPYKFIEQKIKNRDGSYRTITILYEGAQMAHLIANQRKLATKILDRGMSKEFQGMGIYQVRASASDGNREEEAIAMVSLMGKYGDKKLVGEELANSIMKCETKAKRRAIRALCGFGAPDEDDLAFIQQQNNRSVIDQYEEGVRRGPVVDQPHLDNQIPKDDFPEEPTEEINEKEDKDQEKRDDVFQSLMDKFDGDIEKAANWVKKTTNKKFHELNEQELDEVNERLTTPHPANGNKPATPIGKEFNTIGMGDPLVRRKLVIDTLTGFYKKNPKEMKSQDPHKTADHKNYPLEIIREMLGKPYHMVNTNRECNQLDGLVESIIKGREDYNELIELGK